MTLKLSPNFNLSEFTKSQTAARLGIDNSPTDEQIENIRSLVLNVLQPIRDTFKKPVIINSGFRSSKLNAAIRGSKNSQHCFGEAADIEIIGVSNYDLAKFIESNISFDQLILENYTQGEPNSGWVHVSYKRDGNQRPNGPNKVLTAFFDAKGKVTYQSGIIK